MHLKFAKSVKTTVKSVFLSYRQKTSIKDVKNCKNRPQICQRGDDYLGAFV